MQLKFCQYFAADASHHKSESGRDPNGKERSGKDGGGRAGHHHLLPQEDLVRSRRESTSKALVEQAGGDWPNV